MRLKLTDLLDWQDDELDDEANEGMLEIQSGKKSM